MEIKRKFEMLVATRRRFVIRQSPSNKEIACSECGEPMLPTEQAANLFGIKQRRIFQIIDAKEVHFNEMDAGAVMICLNSLAAVLDSEKKLEKINESKNKKI